MNTNMSEQMPKSAAEKKAYDYYHRIFLGENGGPTKGEIVCNIIGAILFYFLLSVFGYCLCAL